MPQSELLTPLVEAAVHYDVAGHDDEYLPPTRDPAKHASARLSKSSSTCSSHVSTDSSSSSAAPLPTTLEEARGVEMLLNTTGIDASDTQQVITFAAGHL